MLQRKVEENVRVWVDEEGEEVCVCVLRERSDCGFGSSGILCDDEPRAQRRYRKRKARRVRERGREREREEVYFCGKLMRSIWAMWLLQHTPRVTSAVPHPRATGIALWAATSPPLLLSFIFKAIRADVCPPFYHESEQTKRQPVVIVCQPPPLKYIYSANTHVWLAFFSRSFPPLESLLHCARWSDSSPVGFLSPLPGPIVRRRFDLWEKNSVTSTPKH